MRVLDIALASLALRASPPQATKHERRLVPAVDDASPETAPRGAIPETRAALIASLWPPPARQCVAPPVYLELAAPAQFGRLNQVAWGAPARIDARALQVRLAAHFGRAA